MAFLAQQVRPPRSGDASSRSAFWGTVILNFVAFFSGSARAFRRPAHSVREPPGKWPALAIHGARRGRSADRSTNHAIVSPMHTKTPWIKALVRIA